MTYRDLLEVLQTMTDEELSQNVTVNTFSDEYFQVAYGSTADELNGVLDKGHHYLVLEY